MTISMTGPFGTCGYCSREFSPQHPGDPFCREFCREALRTERDQGRDKTRVVVQFLERRPPYHVGEQAGFERWRARRLEAAGAARILEI